MQSKLHKLEWHEKMAYLGWKDKQVDKRYDYRRKNGKKRYGKGGEKDANPWAQHLPPTQETTCLYAKPSVDLQCMLWV